jgi:hypothetical protein
MKSQPIIWQHVSLRVYMNWWNGSSGAEATLLTDNGGHWDVILLKSHFNQNICGATHFTVCRIGWTEARRHHCQNCYEAVVCWDPWWHCAPLYLTSRFIAKFGFFGFLWMTQITKFGYLGHPNNWNLNNQIWWFGWIWMSSDDLNLASFKTKFGERFIGEEWNLAWWALFLSPILGIPKFLWSIPEHHERLVVIINQEHITTEISLISTSHIPNIHVCIIYIWSHPW